MHHMERKQSGTNMPSEPSREPYGNIGNSPSGFFSNAQYSDVSHGVFNNVGGDHVTVDHINDISHQGDQSWNYDMRSQNTHIVNSCPHAHLTQAASSVAILSSVCSILDRRSLIQAHHDALGQKVDLLITKTAVVVLPTFLLVWMGFMKFMGKTGQ